MLMGSNKYQFALVLQTIFVAVLGSPSSIEGFCDEGVNSSTASTALHELKKETSIL